MNPTQQTPAPARAPARARRPSTRKLASLLKKSLRESVRGKQCYQRSGDALDQALALGVPIGEPITLRGVALSDDRKGFVFCGGNVETKIVLRDALKAADGREINSGYTNARFARFRVEPYREPKPTPRAKQPATPEASPTAEAGV